MSSSGIADPSILDGLVSPVGVASWAGVAASAERPRRLQVGTASVGNGRPGGGHRRERPLLCSGYAWDDADVARFFAIAEASERYAASCILGEQQMWASAAELGDSCLEPHRYPQCSDRELADPSCGVTGFDPNARIRWVKGIDLASGEDVWVPAVMACFLLSDLVPAERFTYRISTGYAVHTDPIEATVRGICEVAERDANAVLWLQRLPQIGRAHV